MPAAQTSWPQSQQPSGVMRAVFPGRPEAALHAVDTALWNGTRLVTYISGSSLILLRGPNDLLQTISHGESNSLTGVAIDQGSGKIAATDGSEVFIYKPIGQDIGALRWTLQATFAPAERRDPFNCLSWGLPGELLVSGSDLSLISTEGSLRTIWRSKPLASPAKLGLFSHEASLIASTGQNDRLAKIWRRGFIGGGNERFDPVYIGHPAAVTNMRWRRSPPPLDDGSPEQADPVLYTTCTDGKLRVWTANDPHCLQILQLWTEIDMFTAIQPREPLSPGVSNKRRYVTVLEQWDFQAAVQHVNQQSAVSEREQHTRKHLMELAERRPEIAIILDDKGDMSAWGIERVGCKVRHPSDVVNMTNVEGLCFFFPSNLPPREEFLQFASFAASGTVHVLAHYFDGRLQWHKAPVDGLFDPSPSPQALRLEADITGHSSSVDRFFMDPTNKFLLSTSLDSELIVWSNERGALARQCVGRWDSPLMDCHVLSDGRFVISLHEDHLTVWDVMRIRPTKLASQDLKSTSSSRKLCIPGNQSDRWPTLVVAVVDEQRETVSLEITFTTTHADIHSIAPKAQLNGNGTANGHLANGHRKVSYSFCSHTLYDHMATSGNGKILEAHRCAFDRSSNALSLSAANSIELTQGPPTNIAFTQDYVAHTDQNKTTVSIWNLHTASLEHTQVLDRFSPVQSLKWAPFHDFGVLAVILAHKVLLYTSVQQPYIEDRASWTLLKETAINEMTNLPILDAVWVFSNGLLIAAGNQIFSLDLGIVSFQKTEALQELPKSALINRSLHKVAKSLNGSLPIYHPSLLTMLLHCGHRKSYNNILKKLNSSLKYYAEGDDFDSSLGLDYARFSHDPHEPDSKDDPDEPGENSAMSTADRESLSERVSNNAVPWLAEAEKSQLQALLETSDRLAQHEGSVDGFGAQYLASLYQSRNSSADFSWREIFQASQSTTQDILAAETTRAHHDRLLWSDARRTGLFAWLADRDALLAHLEAVARAEFAKAPDRDPIDCSLFYLALRKKAVLASLWRLAPWHKEQRATQRMLQNDFADPRWRTAALKNAFALLGKRRHAYAAAWFLLADDLRAAVRVLADQCADPRLAVAVARAYAGDDSPVLAELLRDVLRPAAAAQHDPYLAAWCAWLRRDHAGMLAAFYPAVAGPPSLRAPDPSLAATYAAARAALAADPRAAAAATARVSLAGEKALVLRCARTMMRMGCGALALALVRDFAFSRVGGNSGGMVETAVAAPLADADVAVDAGGDEAVALDKPEAVALEETKDGGADARRAPAVAPNEASILDDFDF